MKELFVNQLKSELKNFQGELEKLEGEFSVFSCELAKEKKKKLARRLINCRIKKLKLQVKKIKSENLNISYASIMPLLEVLRNKPKVSDDK